MDDNQTNSKDQQDPMPSILKGIEEEQEEINRPSEQDTNDDEYEKNHALLLVEPHKQIHNTLTEDDQYSLSERLRYQAPRHQTDHHEPQYQHQRRRHNVPTKAPSAAPSVSPNLFTQINEPRHEPTRSNVGDFALSASILKYV